MKPAWILVANASQARLLQQDPGAPMVVLHAFHHPESRARSSVLGDAPLGREGSDRSFGGAAYTPRQDPHRKEHLHFAKELADYVEQGAQEGKFASLRLFASSPFLGELKQALGDGARRHLAGTHDVDLTAVGLTEMEHRIQHELGEAR